MTSEMLDIALDAQYRRLRSRIMDTASRVTRHITDYIRRQALLVHYDSVTEDDIDLESGIPLKPMSEVPYPSRVERMKAWVETVSGS